MRGCRQVRANIAWMRSSFLKAKSDGSRGAYDPGESGFRELLAACRKAPLLRSIRGPRQSTTNSTQCVLRLHLSTC